MVSEVYNTDEKKRHTPGEANFCRGQIAKKLPVSLTLLGFGGHETLPPVRASKAGDPLCWAKKIHLTKLAATNRLVTSLCQCNVRGAPSAPQHFLNFLPLPQGQGSLRPIFGPSRTTCLKPVCPPRSTSSSIGPGDSPPRSSFQ